MNNIVLPSLLDFVESHLSAIYNAISQDDTTTAVNDFLSKDATIVVNGKNIYPADLINLFQGETASEVAASVNFNASVVVPYDTMNPNTVIGLYFHSKFRLMKWLLWPLFRLGQLEFFSSFPCKKNSESMEGLGPVQWTRLSMFRMFLIFLTCSTTDVRVTPILQHWSGSKHHPPHDCNSWQFWPKKG